MENEDIKEMHEAVAHLHQLVFWRKVSFPQDKTGDLSRKLNEAHGDLARCRDKLQFLLNLPDSD